MAYHSNGISDRAHQEAADRLSLLQRQIADVHAKVLQSARDGTEKLLVENELLRRQLGLRAEDDAQFNHVVSAPFCLPPTDEPPSLLAPSKAAIKGLTNGSNSRPETNTESECRPAEVSPLSSRESSDIGDAPQAKKRGIEESNQADKRA